MRNLVSDTASIQRVRTSLGASNGLGMGVAVSAPDVPEPAVINNNNNKSNLAYGIPVPPIPESPATSGLHQHPWTSSFGHASWRSTWRSFRSAQRSQDGRQQQLEDGRGPGGRMTMSSEAGGPEMQDGPFTTSFGRDSWRSTWKSWRASSTFARGAVGSGADGRGSMVEYGQAVAVPVVPIAAGQGGGRMMMRSRDSSAEYDDDDDDESIYYNNNSGRGQGQDQQMPGLYNSTILAPAPTPSSSEKRPPWASPGPPPLFEAPQVPRITLSMATATTRSQTPVLVHPGEAAQAAASRQASSGLFETGSLARSSSSSGSNSDEKSRPSLVEVTDLARAAPDVVATSRFSQSPSRVESGSTGFDSYYHNDNAAAPSRGGAHGTDDAQAAGDTPVSEWTSSTFSWDGGESDIYSTRDNGFGLSSFLTRDNVPRQGN